MELVEINSHCELEINSHCELNLTINHYVSLVLSLNSWNNNAIFS